MVYFFISLTIFKTTILIICPFLFYYTRRFKNDNSKIRPRKYKKGINKRPISYLTGYEPKNSNSKLSAKDIALVDTLYKK